MGGSQLAGTIPPGFMEEDTEDKIGACSQTTGAGQSWDQCPGYGLAPSKTHAAFALMGFSLKQSRGALVEHHNWLAAVEQADPQRCLLVH